MCDDLRLKGLLEYAENDFEYLHKFKSNVIEYQSTHYIINFKIRFLTMPKHKYYL
jgi:hypothetical protein